MLLHEANHAKALWRLAAERACTLSAHLQLQSLPHRVIAVRGADIRLVAEELLPLKLAGQLQVQELALCLLQLGCHSRNLTHVHRHCTCRFRQQQENQPRKACCVARRSTHAWGGCQRFAWWTR